MVLKLTSCRLLKSGNFLKIHGKKAKKKKKWRAINCKSSSQILTKHINLGKFHLHDFVSLKV